MTKILRVKIGTCHIENCGRCPAGSSDGLSDMFLGRFTRCGFTAYVYKADRLPKYPMCPLDDLVEEKQAPAEQPPKVSRSAEYLDKKKNDNLIKDNSQLKDRIAQQDSVYQRLERLEDQQKRILGDLNEAYPAGTLRKTTGAKIKELDRRIEALEKGASYVLKVKDEKPAEPEMEKRIAALEKGAPPADLENYYVLDLGPGFKNIYVRKPDVKPVEPEMVICPHSKTCDQEGCDHKTPHKETPHCQSFCEYAPCDTSRCIPVKK